MYPQPSTALDGNPQSFWFVHRVNGRQNVCAMTGYSFLANVQAAIREQLTASGPLPSIGGTISAADIPSIEEGSASGWDEPTLRGLYALIQRYRRPRTELSRVEADVRAGAGRPLSPATTQLALWVAYYSHALRDVTRDGVTTTEDVYGRGTPEDVSFGPGTTQPITGVSPPFPTDSVVTTDPTCVPLSITIPTESPISVTSSYIPNAFLVLAVVAVAVVGVSVVTRKAPRIIDMRKVR